MTDALLELAHAVGLTESWTDAAGAPHVVPDEVMRHVLAAMGYPCDTPRRLTESRNAVELQRRQARSSFVTADMNKPVALPGSRFRHGTARLVLENGAAVDVRLGRNAEGRPVLPPVDVPGYHQLEDGDMATTIAVAPSRAYGVADAGPRARLWGLAVQLYSLRGGPHESFGDFGALANFAEAAASRGADAVAISPVHALFAADASRYSPYAPSSRQFLNVLYAAPAAALSETFVSAALAGEQPLESAGDERLIDWVDAGKAKLRLLARLHDAFQAGAPDAVRADFEQYCRDGGALLQLHACFEALHAHFRQQGIAGDWQCWPAVFRDPASDAVSGFAAAHRREIEFHLFLQWLAERSLAAAQKRAEEAGMALGLIADLAIGLHGGGSHAWSRPDELLAGLSVGAPPDPLNLRGQSWGLTAISPQALAVSGFAPFLATVRAALRHAGGIRIDHVLGLNRLWLVPDGALPTEGAYLRYPLQDLLRLLALESHRHEAIVIGEDLGTVPEGYRERLAASGIMGMSVLWFERQEDGGFTPPDSWQTQRAALTTTHDLPTVAGWWRGRDIDWAERCRIMRGPEEVAAAREARAVDREKLWSTCVAAGSASGDVPATDAPDAVVDAAVGFIAGTAAELALLPIEDALGLDEQPNLPGTIAEHPNWRRRLPADGETLLSRPDVAARLAVLQRRRGAA